MADGQKGTPVSLTSVSSVSGSKKQTPQERFKFTAQQIATLVKYQMVNTRPSVEVRKKIAQEIGVAHERVRNWFSNNRPESDKKKRGKYKTGPGDGTGVMPRPTHPTAGPSTHSSRPSTQPPALAGVSGLSGGLGGLGGSSSSMPYSETVPPPLPGTPTAIKSANPTTTTAATTTTTTASTSASNPNPSTSDTTTTTTTTTAPSPMVPVSVPVVKGPSFPPHILALQEAVEHDAPMTAREHCMKSNVTTSLALNDTVLLGQEPVPLSTPKQAAPPLPLADTTTTTTTTTATSATTDAMEVDTGTQGNGDKSTDTDTVMGNTEDTSTTKPPSSNERTTTTTTTTTTHGGTTGNGNGNSVPAVPPPRPATPPPPILSIISADPDGLTRSTARDIGTHYPLVRYMEFTAQPGSVSAVLQDIVMCCRELSQLDVGVIEHYGTAEEEEKTRAGYIDDDALISVKVNCPNLQSLSLHGIALRGRFLQHLPKLTALTHLSLSSGHLGIGYLSDSQLRGLEDSMPHLRRLSLEGLSDNPSYLVKFFCYAAPKIMNLSTVGLGEIDSSALVAIGSHLKHMQQLDLAFCVSYVDEEAWLAIARGCRALVHLDMCHANISVLGLRAFIQEVPMTFKSLNLWRAACLLSSGDNLSALRTSVGNMVCKGLTIKCLDRGAG